MAGAQLASLPWLTVDSFGLPPPLPPPFPFGFLLAMLWDIKPKKKKRGLVRSLTLRPSVSSTAGFIAQGFPFPLGFISHNIARRNPKGKGVVMSLEAG